jgi:hypothetical protein
MFLIGGTVRQNGRNGTVSLVSNIKKQLATSLESMSPDQIAQFVQGLRVWGTGIVHSKDSVTMDRRTYNKATLKWQGATHEFKKLTPEIYQQLPAAGKYIRFELSLSVREERNQTGQLGLLQFPSLVSVKADDIAIGSIPSTTAAATLATGAAGTGATGTGATSTSTTKSPATSPGKT